MTEDLRRFIPLEGCANFRDLGGYRVQAEIPVLVGSADHAPDKGVRVLASSISET